MFDMNKSVDRRQVLTVLGIILILLGVICLIVYSAAMPQNWLLVCALVLEFIGIVAYVLLNRFANE